MKKVAVVVPAYREKLAEYEEIALRQMEKVLGGYDRYFVAPEGLNVNYGPYCQGMRVLYFAKECFKSTVTYSQMLLSPNFYACFEEYEYILIHQMDAFVFGDRLKEFCDMGFDYIGAPALKYVPLWHYMDARVGNGGLSLRKVASCRRILSNRDFFATHPFRNDFLVYEDTFFGFAGTQPDMDFKVADLVTARKFSLQDEVQHALRGPVIELPFGVHGWQKINTGLWAAVIKKKYGYDTEGIEGENKDYRRYFAVIHLRARKTINVNYIFGCLKNRKPRKALEYFLDWQEREERPPEEDLVLVTALLERLGQYCRMVQRHENENSKLIYELLNQALMHMVGRWKRQD